MRKTFNINLGGLAFIIDENAFEALQNYLEALKRKFSDAAERAEILADIESRMAEMLNQRLGNRKEIVSLEDIEAVINVMGKPEDIAGEEESTQPGHNSSSAGNTTGTGKRRLFRDPDDKRVAGVVSGLCHYLGIEDPTWARLAVVILCFISFGTVLLIYFILMIVIPEAETATDKLQMRGEPINVNTIEKEVKDAAVRTGESVKGFFKDQTIFERSSNVFVNILKIILKIILAFFIFIGTVVLFAMLAGLFGISIAGNAILTRVPYLIIDNPGVITLLKLGLIFFVGAPILGGIYGALRLIFGKNSRAPRMSWLFALLWITGIVLLSVAGWKIARNYKTSATNAVEVALAQPADSLLYVQIADKNGKKLSASDDDDFDVNIDFDGVFINGEDASQMDSIPVDEPELQLVASSDSAYHLYTIYTSRGNTRSDALHNIDVLSYPVMQQGGVINLPPYLLLPKGGKWRGQNVKVQLAIPENKKVQFADNIDRWAAVVKGNHAYDDTYFKNTTWTVDSGAVKCIAGENHYREEKQEKEIRKVEKEKDKLERKIDELERKLEEKNDD